MWTCCVLFVCLWCCWVLYLGGEREGDGGGRERKGGGWNAGGRRRDVAFLRVRSDEETLGVDLVQVAGVGRLCAAPERRGIRWAGVDICKPTPFIKRDTTSLDSGKSTAFSVQRFGIRDFDKTFGK